MLSDPEVQHELKRSFLMSVGLSAVVVSALKLRIVAYTYRLIYVLLLFSHKT